MTVDAEVTRAFSLEGRVAVVTGAGSGLGQEIARIFAAAGARMVLVDIDQAGLSATRDLIGAEDTVCGIVDISVRDEVEALADRVVAETGRLDTWVNCAGLGYQHALLEADPARAERVVAVNMMGCYWGCAAAGRIMQGRGAGTIVNISSGGGQGASPNTAIYSMTKAAVHSLTWTAAAELGPAGVRVNAVAPGFFETPMSRMMFTNAAGQQDQALREQVIGWAKERSPLGIVGQASDIAFACLYLATDSSRYVTGQVLAVSGGMRIG
jgi:3-oxoacyl-[acyl-carrier protein] reductase